MSTRSNFGGLGALRHSLTELHLWVFSASALLLIPVCFRTRVYLAFDISQLSFLASWAVQSISIAGILYQFCVPAAWADAKRIGIRLAIGSIAAVLLFFFQGNNLTALFICLAFLTGMEFHYRGGDWHRLALAIIPWGYLAFGIQLALAYNTAIVSVRHFDRYDRFFRSVDARIFHVSVAAINHAAGPLCPSAEVIYYSMGGFTGSAILFLCLSGRVGEAFRMSGAILLTYYISLFIFFLFPSGGPFILDPAWFPAHSITGGIQLASKTNAAILYQHAEWLRPVFGYFVAFPSVHVTQPLIAGWFLRRWKIVSGAVFGYCILLIPSILILEWHYLADVIAGLLLAVLAIWLSSVNVRIGRRGKDRNEAIEAAYT